MADCQPGLVWWNVATVALCEQYSERFPNVIAASRTVRTVMQAVVRRLSMPPNHTLPLLGTAAVGQQSMHEVTACPYQELSYTHLKKSK